MMQEIKTVFVTGATGKQGGAFIRNLLPMGCRIKALTRNPGSDSSQKLKKQGVEIINGDLDEPFSYKDQLNDVDAIFCVLTYENGIKKEINQGINLADLAKKFNVKHFIYSSVIGADLHTGIPHWESKFRIEQHIQEIGLTYTLLRPNSFYENFLIPQVKSRLLKGKFVSPVDRNKVQQFISTEDVGRFGAKVFMDQETYSGKTITLAAEQMDQQQVAKCFSEVMGKEISYQKLPGFITRLAMGKDLFKMFTWVNKNDAVFVKDLDGFKKEFPEMIDLKTWIRVNFL